MDPGSSSHRTSEYDELQLTLSSMGVYEADMDLHEMREMFQVLQISASENNFLESDVQEALRASEMDFMPIQNDRILNSTMMSVNANTSVDSDSDTQPYNITVQAQVHHEMDWSPPNVGFTQKGLVSTSIVINFSNRSLELQTNVQQNASIDKIDVLDSANSSMQEKASQSLHDVDSVENSLAALSSSFHEIQLSHSERKSNDSGLTEGPHSTPLYLSIEEDENSTSFHEHHGPFSVRRIHDSGLNLSTARPNFSIVNSSTENSTSLPENTVSTSLSSLDNTDNNGA